MNSIVIMFKTIEVLLLDMYTHMHTYTFIMILSVDSEINI